MPNYSFLRQIVTEWAAQNVFSRKVAPIGPGPEFGKKRYLFRIVYGGEHFCRVSELCDLKSLQECKMKRNFESGPTFRLWRPVVARWPRGRIRKIGSFRPDPYMWLCWCRIFRALASIVLAVALADRGPLEVVARTRIIIITRGAFASECKDASLKLEWPWKLKKGHCGSLCPIRHTPMPNYRTLYHKVTVI